jgi:mono/diheme cytochrome c family protein
VLESFSGRVLLLIALILAGCAQPPAKPQPAASTPAHPGKAIYEKACAACHDNPQATRAPAFETLRGMRYGSIHFALTEGKMQAQGASLTAAERSTLIDFLVGRDVVSDAWIAKMMCPADRRAVDLDAVATVAGFGFDKKNHRNLTRAQAGLATADFRDLELAWALAFPKATTMRAQPAVVGSTLFLPVADAAQMFAIDIAGEPCFKWVYKSDVPLRTGAAYGALPGPGGAPGRKVLLLAMWPPTSTCSMPPRAGRSGANPSASRRSRTPRARPSCTATAYTFRSPHLKSRSAPTRSTSAARRMAQSPRSMR